MQRIALSLLFYPFSPASSYFLKIHEIQTTYSKYNFEVLTPGRKIEKQ